MGEDDFGSPGITKSLRSLIEALATMEAEMEMMFERATMSSATSAARYVGKLASAAGHRTASGFDLGSLLKRAGELDFSALTRAVTAAFGLADENALESVRSDVREVVEQVARLRERELALAGGVSHLRAKAARFEEALAGLARVQGKCVARLDAQVERAHRLERLAARRDDHITRLIRDTAAQRAELERVGGEVAAVKREPAEPVADVRSRVGQLEAHYADLKKLHAGSTQRVIETLEAMRDRVAKLEARAAEMSREARAKAGRLDALARHVTSVEGRLTSAIGQRGEGLVPVAKDIDRSMPAIG